MLPEDDSHRLCSPRWMKCYHCNSDIPPTIPFYDHGGTVCCCSCYAELKQSADVATATVSDAEWPEEI